MLVATWRVQPGFELFEALYANQSGFVFHDPGGIGLDLCCLAALASGFSFVALHIGKGRGACVAEQLFLFVAGRTPPGSVEEGAFGFEFKAEDLLTRVGRGKGIGRDGPVAPRCFLGEGSAAGPTAYAGADNAQ